MAVVKMATIVHKPMALEERNLYPYIRISVPTYSMAFFKIRTNFGFLQEAKYQSKLKTHFYMRSPYPHYPEMAINFFETVVRYQKWGQEVEFNKQKGLPL